MEEKELSGPESLALITEMIHKAKKDFLDTGLSALLWGSVISFCALVTFANHWLGWHALDYIWLLTIGAVVPQVIISVREAKNRKHKSYEEDVMGGIWISFAFAVFLLSYFTNAYNLAHQTELFLTIYGVPTFATGFARRFRPMIIGGLACWVFAVIVSFVPWPYQMLFVFAAAQLAWFIPGMIIRACYLKAKQGHV
jgi:hypothetical protein